MDEMTIWTSVMALMAVALVAIGAWRLLLANDPDRSSEPPPLPEPAELPDGHRLLERRQFGEMTLTLAERVRVRGIRAKGWERVVFIDPPGPVPLEHGRAIAHALQDWEQ